MRVSTIVVMRGGCKNAVAFYQDVFGAELAEKVTFAQRPELAPICKEELKECIYRAELLLRRGGKEMSLVLMDSPALLFETSSAAAVPQAGTRDNIQFEIEDEEEEWLREIFGKLAAGGKLNFDLQAKEPYRLFGSLIDRFGICWNVQQV